MLFKNAFGKRYSDWGSLPLEPDSLDKLKQFNRQKSAPVFILNDKRPRDSRAIVRFFAETFGMQLVVVKLPELLDTCFKDADKRINRLFSQPQNRNAVLLVEEADALLTHGRIAEEKAAYLLARISAHQAPVFLVSQVSLPEKFSVAGLCSRVILLNGASDGMALCHAC